MKAGLLKKISLALGLVLWVTGSVCASPADEEGANKANNNLVKVLVCYRTSRQCGIQLFSRQYDY